MSKLRYSERQLLERSKLDNERIVGSEVRELLGRLERTRESRDSLQAELERVKEALRDLLVVIREQEDAVRRCPKDFKPDRLHLNSVIDPVSEEADKAEAALQTQDTRGAEDG